MDKIEVIYERYDSIIRKFKKGAISKKYSSLLQQYKNFLEEMEVDNYTIINEEDLMYAVLDYFTDICRLKEFHKIDRVNSYKRYAYTVKWLLRRHPIQVINVVDNIDTSYLNEKFCNVYLWKFLIKDFNDDIFDKMSDDDKKRYDGYRESLYYYLKYRNCDAQALELALMSFEIGCIFGNTNCSNEENHEIE